MLADIRYWENDATNKHYAIAQALLNKSNFC